MLRLSFQDYLEWGPYKTGNTEARKENLFLMKKYIFLIKDQRTTTNAKGKKSQGKNIAMPLTNKDLIISLVYKELLQIDKKKTNHSKENWTKDMKICRRENLNGQQTEKDLQLHKQSGKCKLKQLNQSSDWQKLEYQHSVLEKICLDGLIFCWWEQEMLKIFWGSYLAVSIQQHNSLTCI